MIMSFTYNPSFLWLPLIGAAIGLLVTIFGGGGGFFYVPILTLLFHVPTQLAAATSLAATIPTVIVGSIEHYRKGNVNLRVGVIFGVAGLVGAFVGAYVSNLVSSALLQKLFGAYALALTIPMVLTSKNRLKNLGGEAKVSQPLTSSRIILVLILWNLIGNHGRSFWNKRYGIHRGRIVHPGFAGDGCRRDIGIGGAF